MKPFLVRLFNTILLLAICHTAWAVIPSNFDVWTIDDGKTVLRSDHKTSGKSISIAGARNEWVSFQILLRSKKAIEGVNIIAKKLRGNKGGAISTRHINLFREHQLKISKPSRDPHKNFKVDWYSDPLIPFVHPETRKPLKGRFTAVPFDLPANQTHAFWVDIYIPPKTPAGQYKTKFQVTSKEGKEIDVPIKCTVWRFTLPNYKTFKTRIKISTHAMYDRLSKKNITYTRDGVEEQYFNLRSRHYIDAGLYLPEPTRQANGRYQFSKSKMQNFVKLAHQYHVNAYHIKRVSTVFSDPVKQRKEIHAYLKAYNKVYAALKIPGFTFFDHIMDEPHDKKGYDHIRQWGKCIREAKSVVKTLVTEQSRPEDAAHGNLYGAIDIWCPLFPYFNAESALKRQKKGEAFWAYTALVQKGGRTPVWFIDYPLLNFRVSMWTSFRYDIKGMLYWGGAHWDQAKDPWTNPVTHAAGKYVYNGGGNLVYPGDDVGLLGVVPSVRLKAIRDGIEDYEYFVMAQKRKKKVKSVVHGLAKTWDKWEENPLKYAKVRQKIGRFLSGKSSENVKPKKAVAATKKTKRVKASAMSLDAQSLKDYHRQIINEIFLASEAGKKLDYSVSSSKETTHVADFKKTGQFSAVVYMGAADVRMPSRWSRLAPSEKLSLFDSLGSDHIKDKRRHIYRAVLLIESGLWKKAQSSIVLAGELGVAFTKTMKKAADLKVGSLEGQ